MTDTTYPKIRPAADTEFPPPYDGTVPKGWREVADGEVIEEGDIFWATARLTPDVPGAWMETVAVGLHAMPGSFFRRLPDHLRDATEMVPEPSPVAVRRFVVTLPADHSWASASIIKTQFDRRMAEDIKWADDEIRACLRLGDYDRAKDLVDSHKAMRELPEAFVEEVAP